MQYTKTILAFLVCSLPLTAELSIQNIEKMVKDIRTKRTSKLKEHNIPSSPFIVVKKDENSSVKTSVPIEQKKAFFTLGAIMNSSAFIDGAWHKQGDKLNDYNIDKVADDHVVLKKKNRTITLFFRKAKSIIKIGKE